MTSAATQCVGHAADLVSMVSGVDGNGPGYMCRKCFYAYEKFLKAKVTTEESVAKALDAITPTLISPLSSPTPKRSSPNPTDSAPDSDDEQIYDEEIPPSFTNTELAVVEACHKRLNSNFVSALTHHFTNAAVSWVSSWRDDLSMSRKQLRSVFPPNAI